jgi:parallel beta-helix repeat protein
VRKVPIVAAIGILLFAVAPASHAVPGVQCGEVVKKDVALEHNLVDCPGDAITIAAPGVAVDLGDFTIDGTGKGVGINNEKGYNDVIVEGDGTINGFDIGVSMTNKPENAVISDVDFSDNNVAVVLEDSVAAALEDNVVDGNEFGFAISGTRNLVAGNEFFDSGTAVAIKGSRNEISQNEMTYSVRNKVGAAIAFDGDHNVLERNDVLAGDTGIDGIGSDNVLFKNSLEGGSGDGILLEGSSNELEKNETLSYGGYGIRLFDDDPGGSTLLKNRAEGNGSDGLLVALDNVQLEKNELFDNGGDGAQIDGDDAALVKNDADGNAAYGLRVDGKGAEAENNDAKDNGAAAQCRPAAVCD